jgi:AcrR family transcriptional regulator
MEQSASHAGPGREKLPRGSHGLPIEFVVRSQRERLFAGMAKVMARAGYAATTVDDIALESGVSRKALYAHFSGKEDVLLQAHRAIAERIAAGAGPAVAKQPDWKSAFRAFFDWTLEFFAGEPSFAHLAFIEMPAATPATRQLQRGSLMPLRKLIGQGMDEGAQPMTDVAIDGVLGGLTYVIAKAAEEGGSAEIRKLRPKLMAWIVLVLEGPDAAERELIEEIVSS